MRHATQPRRQAETQAAPKAELPQFRKLGISAVVAASVWPRRPEPKTPCRAEEPADRPKR